MGETKHFIFGQHFRVRVNLPCGHGADCYILGWLMRRQGYKHLCTHCVGRHWPHHFFQTPFDFFSELLSRAWRRYTVKEFTFETCFPFRLQRGVLLPIVLKSAPELFWESGIVLGQFQSQRRILLNGDCYNGALPEQQLLLLLARGAKRTVLQ